MNSDHTTSTKGRSVAETYLKEAGWRVRGITRDATKPDSLALAAKGVEIVEGDLDDVESLKAALQGASVVFGNTVFPFMLALTSNPQLKIGQSILEWAYELEVQQGKNLVEAVAKLDSLQLFIWSTLSATRKWSGGKFQNVYHFDSKAAVVDHVRIYYPDLYKKMSMLQLGLFMTNWKFGPVNIPWVKVRAFWILTRVLHMLHVDTLVDQKLSGSSRETARWSSVCQENSNIQFHMFSFRKQENTSRH